MPNLDNDQIRQVKQILVKQVTDNNAFYNKIWNKLADSKTTSEALNKIIDERLEVLNNNRPHFLQKSFYTNSVLGSLLAFATIILSGTFLQYKDYIDINSIVHESIFTKEYIISEMALTKGSNPSSLDEAFRIKFDALAKDSESDFQDIIHSAIEKRPVLVYSARLLLSVGYKEDISEECILFINAHNKRIKDYYLLIENEQNSLDPNTARVESFNMSINFLTDELRRKLRICTKIVDQNELSFPFYANFGKRRDESFDVSAVVRVSVPKKDQLEVSLEPEFEPLPVDMNDNISFQIEFGDREFVISPENRINVRAGEYIVSLDDEYWRGLQDSGLNPESEIFHVLTIKFDDEIIMERESINCSVAIFINTDEK